MDFCLKQVQSDCEELLSRFQRSESVRFENFSEIWREMKFFQIFYGTTKRQKRMFARLILDKAYSFFLPPFSFQIRVGALYLLYSLYGCQTASPQEQIRVPLKDWEDIKRFEKDAVDAQHLDVVYILRQLMAQKAFYFTAMPTLLSYNKKRKLQKSLQCVGFMEPSSRPQELVSTELLEELAHIHGLYGKMKGSVFPSTEQSASSVQLIRKDLVLELRRTVVDFYQWQCKKESDEDEDDGGEGTSLQQECSKRADLLASIKSKAFGQASETCRSRRHRHVELNVSSNEVGSSGFPSAQRLSLKARTKRDVRISGDMRKEAETRTQINRLTSLDFPVTKNIQKTQKEVSSEDDDA
ncbi:snRNA-activating protein complex subunit 1b [Takifugu rubripes]|uniref:Small nuclear RNA activating complex, polypeptide 1b n=1 Tax=Takifugu rubripes TaxID=31033 RepID=H2S607_TAKRU|nr:snRNA-activating protein complex subunit 1 [Takifugu rubripes]|eukprot:XP_003978679.1 PREDICTED: snRNA-activating protein complex subunit 1 [Takifugu rubripes]